MTKLLWLICSNMVPPHFPLIPILIQGYIVFVQRVHNAIHWINNYSVDAIIFFVVAYPLVIIIDFLVDSIMQSLTPEPRCILNG